MSTPLERLQRIIDAYVPSVVKFSAGTSHSDGSLILNQFIVKESSNKEIEDDKELQKIFRESRLNEAWSDDGHYIVNVDTNDLFRDIKNTILRIYDVVSNRSVATKRKTELFVKGIRLEEDKNLANFLIQMFIEIHRPEFNTKKSIEKEAYFESLELMRRTYGKRSS